MSLVKTETHAAAIKRLKLKKGDSVLVVEKAKDNERGWENTWIASSMDRYIGQVGTVKKTDVQIGVDVDFSDGRIVYTYPAFVLKKVEENIATPAEKKQDPQQTILDTAKSLIYGDREKDYGKTSDNFADIAKGWEVLFKTTITPEQVGLAMAWLKICRANKDNCAKMDSLVDLAGYAGCIEKIKLNQ
jgi:hypothetical protein